MYACIINSIALKYKEVIELAEKLTGKKYGQVNIVGGGSKDAALCGFTAKMTGMDVYAGPYEATVIGNILSQLISLGEIRDINEAKSVIYKSFSPVKFTSNA